MGVASRAATANQRIAAVLTTPNHQSTKFHRWLLRRRGGRAATANQRYRRLFNHAQPPINDISSAAPATTRRTRPGYKYECGAPDRAVCSSTLLEQDLPGQTRTDILDRRKLQSTVILFLAGTLVIFEPDKMTAELKDLIGRRGVMKRQIIAFQKFFDGGTFTDASTRMELSMRTTRLEASYGEFLAGQTQIELLDSREEQLAERSAVETAYYAAISPAMVLLEAAQVNQRRASQASSIQGAAENLRRPNTESAIRLPPISLPEFDGDYKRWLNYRDTFDSFVHRHKDLSDIQKLHYLKSSLRNEAAQVIESLETTAANYLPAWEQLCERYDNHRKMVGGHIHALCSMPSITKASSAILRSHQNGMNSHLRALTALKLPVEHWDAIIIHLMVEKLDIESHHLWESSRSSASLPSIQEYLAFLNQRCLTLESIETRANNSKIVLPNPHYNTKQLAPKKRSYTTAFAATNKSVSSCTLCSGQHALGACQRFLGMTVSERREHARSKRLCYNCLRPDHMSRVCSRGSCRTCRGKHHTLLHIIASAEVQVATAPDAIESQQ